MSVLAVALLGLGGVSCLPQPTPHPEMRSTWPDNIFPGEECLPYDGSKVPDCSKFVDPVLKQPYYHEHSSNCSRFWECGPALETCLFECAACCRCADDQSLCTDENGWQCSSQCNDKDLGSVQWALTFDDKFHFFPEGPTCVWPVDYTGNCTNAPAPCSCLPWQICLGDQCSPQCVEDSHCPDGYICDDCGWCVPSDNGCDGLDANCPPTDAICNIPNHENCFYCDGEECVIGCAGAPNCPANRPICGGDNGDHRCGCNENSDCPSNLPLCQDGGDGKECVAGCLDDLGCGCNASVMCDIPEHADCNYCDMGSQQCANGCCSDENCPDTHPHCGYEGGEHLCGCDKDSQCLEGFICDSHMCVAGCRDDGACGCDASMKCDVPDHKDCHYCDVDALQCKNGCCIDDNCPDTHPVCGYAGGENLCGCDTDDQCNTGFICEGHACVEDLGCNSIDENCVGFNETCTNPPPHQDDVCFWCNGKDCELGCATTANCPETYPVCGHGGADHLCGCEADIDCRPGYTCNLAEHACTAIPGKVLIDSIKIYSDSCDGCSEEGVKMKLLGTRDSVYPDGLPCQTNSLDHKGSIDFASGSTVFNGKKDGHVDSEEKNMMGSCYEGALNAHLSDGGEVTWEGAGTWSPQLSQGVCVDWRDEAAYVWVCDLSGSGSPWPLGNCQEILDKNCP